jgi:hypothetical protein
MPRLPRLRRAGSEKVDVLLQFNRPHPALPHEGLEAEDRIERRALAMWPRLDHRALHRCHGDTGKIATQVARRTKMSRKQIVALIAD